MTCNLLHHPFPRHLISPRGSPVPISSHSSFLFPTALSTTHVLSVAMDLSTLNIKRSHNMCLWVWLLWYHVMWRLSHVTAPVRIVPVTAEECPIVWLQCLCPFIHLKVGVCVTSTIWQLWVGRDMVWVWTTQTGSYVEPLVPDRKVSSGKKLKQNYPSKMNLIRVKGHCVCGRHDQALRWESIKNSTAY